MLEGFAKQHDATAELGQRVVKLEIRTKDLEERVARQSIRAQNPSAHDLEMQAEIANERASREKLAGKVDKIEQMVSSSHAATAKIEKAVTGVLSHPRTQALSWALWVALVGVLASRCGIQVPL